MCHYVWNHCWTLGVTFGTELFSFIFYEKSPEIWIHHSWILFIKSESNPNTDLTPTKCVSSESFEVYHLVITVALVHWIRTIFSQRIGTWAACHALNQNTSGHWRSRDLFVWSVHTITIHQISAFMGKFPDPTKPALLLKSRKFTLGDIISKFICTLFLLVFFTDFISRIQSRQAFWKVVDQKIDWAGLLSVKSTLFIRAIV